jgi:8-oxo-dGTP pyrophosphatase MutT (NUDIX family)
MKTDLLSLLRAYCPTDAQEMKFKEEILSFIASNEDCYGRNPKVGHITSSAWLLNSSGEKALLMHHKKLDIWVQPGGHCDGDNDVLNSAIREAKEESGISDIVPVNYEIFDIDIHTIPENKNESEHQHYDIRFLLKTSDNDNFNMNVESKELSWISKDSNKLPNVSDSILRMFNKWIKI